MKDFMHFNAYSVDEAVALLSRYGGNAGIIAGGTDLLGKMKDRILPSYPEALINIKTIPGLDQIENKEGMISIGALVTLSRVAEHPVIRKEFTALAEAASRTASPHLRNMGTLAGNICQDIRCWYYRAPQNRFSCLRKGGGRCYAIKGDNRYHSIFGGSVKAGCFAVHPSDTAPALIALNARIITSRRSISAETFFNVGVTHTTALSNDEIVTAIQIPTSAQETRSAFLKFALRKSIDFPIVNCAASITQKNSMVMHARICLNAVSVVPRRAEKAEEALINRTIDETTADEAAVAAVADAKPMEGNAYMVPITRTLVRRAILACREIHGG
ncbi:MAG: molybdopterin dehydrogenase [Desulfobacterium sp.]|nr:molybdopterin dehydrogenase [Desulfobacterium sp.]